MNIKEQMNLLRKKPYCKPELNAIQVDREISLIMMTSETDPGGGPRGAPPMPASQFEKTKLNENPFNEKY